MARFYKGQPVICVDDRRRRSVTSRYPGLIWPVKGQHYVIRHPEIPQRSALNFVTVVSIRNRIITWPCGNRFEAGFHEDRFEPATDITLLEDIKDFAGLQADRRSEPTAPARRKKEDA